MKKKKSKRKQYSNLYIYSKPVIPYIEHYETKSLSKSRKKCRQLLHPMSNPCIETPFWLFEKVISCPLPRAEKTLKQLIEEENSDQHPQRKLYA